MNLNVVKNAFINCMEALSMVKFGRSSGKFLCVSVFVFIVITAYVFSVMGFQG